MRSSLDGYGAVCGCLDVENQLVAPADLACSAWLSSAVAAGCTRSADRRPVRLHHAPALLLSISHKRPEPVAVWLPL